MARRIHPFLAFSLPVHDETTAILAYALFEFVGDANRLV
jgi:hypothetical protein